MSTILIVDDEPDVLDVLELYLGEMGIDTVKASNGKEALSTLIKHIDRITAVISDIKMPEMDGLEFLGEVTKKHLPVPVMILTGFEDKDKILRALRLGAFDFFAKPLDIKAVEPRIRQAVELGSQIKQAESEIQTLVDAGKIPEQSASLIKTLKINEIKDGFKR